MADKETTQRNYVGDDVPGLDLVDVSGQKSNPYTTSVVKQDAKNDDPPNSPKGNRNAVLQPANTGGAARRIAAATSYPQQEGSAAYGQRTKTVTGPHKRAVAEANDASKGK